MSYYVINGLDDSIVEHFDGRPSPAQLQRCANEMECPVYVIEGQHAGMTAAPEPKKDKYKAR